MNGRGGAYLLVSLPALTWCRHCWVAHAGRLSVPGEAISLVELAGIAGFHSSFGVGFNQTVRT